MAISLIPAAFLFAAAVAIAAANTPAFNVPTIAFDDGYAPLFGERNIVRSPDGRAVKIILNHDSGSGFISSDLYYHGFFSTSIKLPSEYTAGVVVAFYMSNGDIFEKDHDELDFEFLGNVLGREWRVQTNVYGNGSTSRGREERYRLPFDPMVEAHLYSILWTNTTIIFYIDDIPIREVKRSRAMGGDFPSKPMLVYATIWDGSNWATSGGKHKINYKFAPFTSDFSDLALRGCRLDPIQPLPADAQCLEADAETNAAAYSIITPVKREAMLRFRRRHMIYSFCYDRLRYPVTFPDCEVLEAEKVKFGNSGHVMPQQKLPASRHRLRRRGRAGRGVVPAKGRAEV
ncbi:putative xyloglucan endotransglucosylase/hydrolase protein 30 [Platanthera zijinensis]|uniref:Xyloglucan endotransglucosylase/hydrolase n=1 Tax=Platanthera zijinensis TaxID=2320716 RepID=A0AAP0BCE8_9ASPA